MEQTLTSPSGLAERWAELQREQPGIRIRHGARELGVSEMQLLLLNESTIRLEPEFQAILKSLEGLGKVMALTRNEHAVHERKGVYRNASFAQGPVWLFVGEDIDLRIFPGPWYQAFAVREESPRGTRHSLQFFGQDGAAIHKVYMTEDSDQEAYLALVKRFRAEAQRPELTLVPGRPAMPSIPDDQVDVGAFQAEWLALQDTHDFHMLLHKHHVQRTQALRLAPAGYATRVAPFAVRMLLEQAAARQVPIMVFVGNPGMLQIHTGPVQHVVEARGWFNVLDPDFNLHLKDKAIAEAWVVRKPTRDGMVTALECYDAEGMQIVQFFGKRKPGIPELDTWRALVVDLEQEHGL
ncbi:MAG: hemin-degrading factor [Flavobacteriales bacterium]|nr:hemin-degrading factor [Flavobacteriales bacterium]